MIRVEPPEQFNLADYLLDERIREGRGEHPALITARGKLTYREVQIQANQAAHVLRESGLECEQRVLIALPDGPQYVAALFATLKVGAVVVMANPALSTAEINELIDYTRATLLLCPDGVEASGRCLKRVLTQSTLGDAMKSASPHYENFPTHRDDVAIWLFSGGTTGRPKAVLQSHRSFFNTTELYGKRFLGYAPDDRTLSVPKLFFGYATGSNLFFPFSVGATSILFEEKCSADVLFQLIAEHRPTLLINVPTMVNHMLAHPQAAQQDLSCLRLATSAGEALPESLYHKWKNTFGVELLDGLGTAEMWHVFLSNRPGAVRPGTLGQAVPGFEVRICDDQGTPLPPGEVGRLWVSGDSRALCYWQEAEKSHEAFRGNTYVSGDLLRQDEDGYFHYCGRGDEMLKVAGRWLAPQEVESCLLTHTAVKECAVVGVSGEDGLIRPHAYVMSPQAGPALEEELKAYVLARLEAYKHPRRIHFVESLPRTHLGKVDRGALRLGAHG